MLSRRRASISLGLSTLLQLAARSSTPSMPEARTPGAGASDGDRCGVLNLILDCTPSVPDSSLAALSEAELRLERLAKHQGWKIQRYAIGKSGLQTLNAGRCGPLRTARSTTPLGSILSQVLDGGRSDEEKRIALFTDGVVDTSEGDCKDSADATKREYERALELVHTNSTLSVFLKGPDGGDAGSCRVLRPDAGERIYALPIGDEEPFLSLLRRDAEGVCKGRCLKDCSAGRWLFPDGGPRSCADRDATDASLYEPVETRCDGLDNDCDGRPDETDTGELQVPCERQLGVCAGSHIACSLARRAAGAHAGEIITAAHCSKEAYGVDYEESETRCDGLDNDCDGKPDGTDAGELQIPCDLQLGVCAVGHVGCSQARRAARANAGQIITAAHCSKDAYGIDYEEHETRCDGRDNDCNGTIDFDSDGGTLALVCAKQAGVCRGSRVSCRRDAGDAATAANPLDPCGPEDYRAHSARYQVVETLCDNLDNDCDGKVDDGCGAESELARVVAVGNERGYLCSGVAVSAGLVLTARHCLPATRVLFGESIASPQRILRVRSTALPSDPRLDLAALIVPEDRPTPELALRSDRNPTPPRALLRMAGFGARDSTGRYGFGVKHSTEWPSSGWGCDLTNQERLGCLAGLEMYVAAGPGRDTCSGDSGGPVFEIANGGDGAGRGGPQIRLVGITSRAAQGAATACGGGGIYVRIDSAEAWIRALVDGLRRARGG